MKKQPERPIIEPPNSITAECSVLGAMLLGDAEAIETAFGGLTAADFYRDAHQMLFAAMQSLQFSGKPIDMVSVSAAVQEMPFDDKRTLSEVLSVDYLMTLTGYGENIPIGNVSHHVRIIRDKAQLRRLIEVTTQLRERAFRQEETPDRLLSSAEREILAIDRTAGQSTAKRVGPMVAQAVTEAFDRRENGVTLSGLATGLPDADNILKGLAPGDLFILAARPGMGKSALAMSIALRVASRGEPVLVFSLEMSEVQLRQRFLASIARVSLSAIKDGSFSDDDGKRLQQAERLSRLWPLDVIDDSDLTTAQILSKCRRHKPALVVIDYLQYLSDPTDVRRYSNANDIATANVKACKKIAREVRCPVLLLSQLSRAVERREDKRPLLSDLRDSGSIEQEADIVAFLYRASYYSRDKKPLDGQADEVEFIVAKNRQGELDYTTLGFFGAWARFDTLERREGF